MSSRASIAADVGDMSAHSHRQRVHRFSRVQRVFIASVLLTQVWMLGVVAGMSGPNGAPLALMLLLAATAHLGLGATLGKLGSVLPAAGLAWGTVLEAAGAGGDVSPLTVGAVYAVIGAGLAWAGARLRTRSP
jgi:hypothetical protein